MTPSFPNFVLQSKAFAAVGHLPQLHGLVRHRCPGHHRATSLDGRLEMLEMFAW